MRLLGFILALAYAQSGDILEYELSSKFEEKLDDTVSRIVFLQKAGQNIQNMLSMNKRGIEVCMRKMEKNQEHLSTTIRKLHFELLCYVLALSGFIPLINIFTILFKRRKQYRYPVRQNEKLNEKLIVRETQL